MNDFDPHWTDEHDRIFTELVHVFGNDWTSITAEMNDRFTDRQYHHALIQQHWRQLQHRRRPGPVVLAQVVPAEDMMRTGNPWTSEEEAYLVELVHTYGNQWTKVARIMQQRFGAARTYNLNSIKRKWKYMTSTVCKQPVARALLWTTPEESYLELLVRQHGRKWTEIAERMEAQFGHMRQYTDKKVQAKWRAFTTKAEASRALSVSGDGPVPADTSNLTPLEPSLDTKANIFEDAGLEDPDTVQSSSMESMMISGDDFIM